MGLQVRDGLWESKGRVVSMLEDRTIGGKVWVNEM